jgi:hypothetical protein
MRAIFGLAVVLAAIGSTDGVAFACSCARVATFDEVAAGAQIVVVGRVRSVDEALPSTPDEAGVVTVVLPPFRGERIALDVIGVVKGRLTGDRISVWNPIHGECAGGTLRRAPSGAPVVIAMRPLVDAPDAQRRAWSLLFQPRPEDYVVASTGCGETLRVLSEDEATDWTARR